MELRHASGGREALQIVAERRPDLLVLDLMMPDVSGFHVLAELRSRPDTADLAVVILSAKQLTQAELAMLSQNAQGVFSKASASRDDILTQIRRLLGTDTVAQTLKGE